MATSTEGVSKPLSQSPQDPMPQNKGLHHDSDQQLIVFKPHARPKLTKLVWHPIDPTLKATKDVDRVLSVSPDFALWFLIWYIEVM